MGPKQQEARLNTLLAYFIGESEEYHRLEIPERREERRNLLRSLRAKGCRRNSWERCSEAAGISIILKIDSI